MIGFNHIRVLQSSGSEREVCLSSDGLRIALGCGFDPATSASWSQHLTPVVTPLVDQPIDPNEFVCTNNTHQRLLKHSPPIFDTHSGTVIMDVAHVDTHTLGVLCVSEKKIRHIFLVNRCQSQSLHPSRIKDIVSFVVKTKAATVEMRGVINLDLFQALFWQHRLLTHVDIDSIDCLANSMRVLSTVQTAVSMSHCLLSLVIRWNTSRGAIDVTDADPIFQSLRKLPFRVFTLTMQFLSIRRDRVYEFESMADHVVLEQPILPAEYDTKAIVTTKTPVSVYLPVHMETEIVRGDGDDGENETIKLVYDDYSMESVLFMTYSS
ncbi:MAG TPA: hypothetical protein VEF04_20630 [Blastocatellia bacterium]|nr:hypothetical protein [Blastocatellia bacterium]